MNSEEYVIYRVKYPKSDISKGSLYSLFVVEAINVALLSLIDSGLSVLVELSECQQLFEFYYANFLQKQRCILFAHENLHFVCVIFCGEQGGKSWL